MPRQLRFGLLGSGTSLTEWQELARKVEALGYSTLVVSDHFDKRFAPLPALVSAADVTTTLRLGTIVLDNDFRHPAMLAKEAATVDVLSNGRFELGLGAGWLAADYARSGISFDAPGTRIARAREAIQICKACFSATAPVTYAGQHYQVNELEAFPRPIQTPRPPIMAGGRQRRMLQLAAREVDIVGISLLDQRTPDGPAPPTFAQKVQWVRDAAADRFDQIELHVNTPRVEVTDQPASASERIAAQLGVQPDELLRTPGTLIGSVESIVEQMHGWRERFDISYFVFPERLIDTLAPIVARAAGT